MNDDVKELWALIELYVDARRDMDYAQMFLADFERESDRRDEAKNAVNDWLRKHGLLE